MKFRALVIVFSNGKVTIPEAHIEATDKLLRDCIFHGEKFVYVQGDHGLDGLQLINLDRIEYTYIHTEG